MELPTYEQARKIPFAARPLAALSAHNPFARDGSRPTSPVSLEIGDTSDTLKRRRPLSRKHVEQAVRLYGETLQEDLAGDYALDLHFSALDYSLKALPDQSFDDAPARKATIRRRLSKLLEQVGSDSAPQPPQDSKWWQHAALPFGGSAPPPMSAPRADGSFELLGTCPSCATRVPVTVPSWMASGNPPKKAPATWEELAVASVVGLAVAIKQSPIPLLITSFFSALMQAMLYLDDRFEVHQRFLLLLGGIIEALVVLDRELGVLRRVGDLLHKLWEIGISAMLAFAKAEGYQSAPRAGPGGPPLPSSGLSAMSVEEQPMLLTTAPTPRRQGSSQGHSTRSSWPSKSLGPTPLASTSSMMWRDGLRSPASFDTLRSATLDGANTDYDEALSAQSASRRRDDSWTGKAFNLVPGRRS